MTWLIMLLILGALILGIAVGYVGSDVKLYKDYELKANEVPHEKAV